MNKNRLAFDQCCVSHGLSMKNVPQFFGTLSSVKVGIVFSKIINEYTIDEEEELVTSTSNDPSSYDFGESSRPLAVKKNGGAPMGDEFDQQEDVSIKKKQWKSDESSPKILDEVVKKKTKGDLLKEPNLIRNFSEKKQKKELKKATGGYQAAPNIDYLFEDNLSMPKALISDNSILASDLIDTNADAKTKDDLVPNTVFREEPLFIKRMFDQCQTSCGLDLTEIPLLPGSLLSAKVGLVFDKAQLAFRQDFKRRQQEVKLQDQADAQTPEEIQINHSNSSASSIEYHDENEETAKPAPVASVPLFFPIVTTPNNLSSNNIRSFNSNFTIPKKLKKASSIFTENPSSKLTSRNANFKCLETSSFVSGQANLPKPREDSELNTASEFILQDNYPILKNLPKPTEDSANSIKKRPIIEKSGHYTLGLSAKILEKRNKKSIKGKLGKSDQKICDASIEKLKAKKSRRDMVDEHLREEAEILAFMRNEKKMLNLDSTAEKLIAPKAKTSECLEVDADDLENIEFLPLDNSLNDEEILTENICKNESSETTPINFHNLKKRKIESPVVVWPSSEDELEENDLMEIDEDEIFGKQKMGRGFERSYSREIFGSLHSSKVGLILEKASKIPKNMVGKITRKEAETQTIEDISKKYVTTQTQTTKSKSRMVSVEVQTLSIPEKTTSSIGIQAAPIVLSTNETQTTEDLFVEKVHFEENTYNQAKSDFINEVDDITFSSNKTVGNSVNFELDETSWKGLGKNKNRVVESQYEYKNKLDNGHNYSQKEVSKNFSDSSCMAVPSHSQLTGQISERLEKNEKKGQLSIVQIHEEDEEEDQPNAGQLCVATKSTDALDKLPTNLQSPAAFDTNLRDNLAQNVREARRHNLVDYNPSMIERVLNIIHGG